MKRNNITDFDPQDFTSDKQRDLYNYWLRIKQDSEMPSRKDFNPVDIPHLLSSLWMANVICADTPKFTIRLLGTEIVEAFKFEGANRPLEEIYFSGDIIQRFKNLVTTKKPYYYQGDFLIKSEDYKYYSSLTLPLSSDHEKVDIIVSSVHCFN